MSDRIQDSERHLERQRRLIGDLARDGHDTVLAEQELDALMRGHDQLKASQARLQEDFHEHCKRGTDATHQLTFDAQASSR